MTKPDFHMHSAFSDGVLSPIQLVEKAAALGVTIMALTDHDTFAGVDELKDVKTPIPVLTGVELSLRDMPGLHLLGYTETAGGKIRSVVEDLAWKRVHRARQMVENLTSMGIPLDWDDVTHGCAGTVGRAHIARAMVKAGYADTVQQAIQRYLAEDKPAYVAGKRLSMGEALPLMRASGFVPVLAHPALLGKDDMTLRILLGHWQQQGLMGVEVFHPSLAGRTAQLEQTARRMSLLVTGGSDYHRDGDSHGMPGSTCAHWRQADNDTARLLEAIRQ